MPIRPALINDIQATLGAGMIPSLTAASAGSDIFEAYVLTRVLEAARAEQATITYGNVLGTAVNNFVFRTSPGYIFSRVQPYSHAIIEFPDKPALEAHVGIRVSGRSGVLHECDVAVLDRGEAIVCRANQVSPRASKVVLAVECKFYGSDIPLGLARSFLGLVADVSSKDRFFVVNTESRSVERLLAHHEKEWDHLIAPASPTVPRLVSQFRTTFKNYKAKK